MSNNDIDVSERTRLALLKLASAVADHASAAEFIYNVDVEK